MSSSPSSSPPTKLRLLIISSPTLHTSNLLSTLFLSPPWSYEDRKVHAVVMAGCGGIDKEGKEGEAHNDAPLTFDPLRTPESSSSIVGVTSCVLSQLETIVCRVLYIPSPTTSPKSLLKTTPLPLSSTSASSDKLRLTPNSRNVDRLLLPLTSSLSVFGNVERTNITLGTVGPDGCMDHIEDSDDESIGVREEEETKGWNFLDKGIEISKGSGCRKCVVLTSFNPLNRTPGSYHEALTSQPQSYVRYLTRDEVQGNVLLNVDSGRGGECLDVNVGGVRVVTPGWLSRGDFAIAELDFVEGDWRVGKVGFHNLYKSKS